MGNAKSKIDIDRSNVGVLELSLKNKPKNKIIEELTNKHIINDTETTTFGVVWEQSQVESLKLLNKYDISINTILFIDDTSPFDRIIKKWVIDEDLLDLAFKNKVIINKTSFDNILANKMQFIKYISNMEVDENLFTKCQTENDFDFLFKIYLANDCKKLSEHMEIIKTLGFSFRKKELMTKYYLFLNFDRIDLSVIDMIIRFGNISMLMNVNEKYIHNLDIYLQNGKTILFSLMEYGIEFDHDTVYDSETVNTSKIYINDDYMLYFSQNNLVNLCIDVV